MPTRLGYLDRIDHPSPDLLEKLRGGERAIEGLPIRLVIVLVGLADSSGIGQ